MARRVPGGARFRVGQIISHKRFSYRGVITGWDRTCEGTQEWMAQMNVDALPSAPALLVAFSYLIAACACDLSAVMRMGGGATGPLSGAKETLCEQVMLVYCFMKVGCYILLGLGKP